MTLDQLIAKAKALRKAKEKKSQAEKRATYNKAYRKRNRKKINQLSREYYHRKKAAQTVKEKPEPIFKIDWTKVKEFADKIQND